MSKSVLPVFFSKSFIVSSLTFRSLLHSGASRVVAAAAAAKSLQSCPTLHDPKDGSPPGSSVHEIFQAKVLEWVAIAFSHVLLHNSNFCTPFKEQSYRNDPSGQAQTGPKSLCCSYSTLLLQYESRHRQYTRNGCGCMPIKLYL